MINFLLENAEYIFWINIFVIVTFLIVYLKDLMSVITYWINTNSFNMKDFVSSIIKVFLPATVLVADWISNGFFSKYISKSYFIYLSLALYISLIAYIFYKIKIGKKGEKPFYKVFVLKRRSFDSVIIYFLILIITYPIFNDLYLKQKTEIRFKVISKNANHFFVDSYKENLQVDYELEISNSSDEAYDVFIETNYSTFISELLDRKFEDTLSYEPPCGNSFFSSCELFPNKESTCELLSAEVYFPNLYNFPINLNLSQIIIDKPICDSCNVEMNHLPLIADNTGITFVGEYKRKEGMEIPTLEFPVFWRSKINIYSRDKLKYNYIFFGYISHQPFVLDNSKTAFALSGNLIEMVGMYNNYKFFDVPKLLDEKIYSVLFMDPIKNQFSNCYELNDVRWRSQVKNERIIINNTIKYRPFYTNMHIVTESNATHNYVGNQLLTFLADTNRKIVTAYRQKYDWTK